ncbi:MAG: transporter substrate-binding domain-containing protein [Thiohalocapsa sp.]|uniref:transporter substrate-binding domain-containing protein n=1 Tax=Thiohalocapsa sp. TaxID=2497641 RepID=UPI0025E0E734|nr:transporter substrate-binding domain-containing protein [Thiohalocapsa sp.]MCG6943115.1 transporter substrate-binding domain-containing protein [Thiohalocapsa sp.]
MPSRADPLATRRRRRSMRGRHLAVAVLLWAGPSLALSLALMGSAQPAAAEALRIGVFGQDPPRSFVDEQGELHGLDVDVARALCAAMHFACELVPMEWSALLPAVEDRTLDAAVASISITDARRERVDFTRPYYRTPARFVARRSTLVAVDPRNLAGKRIGVRRGTTFDDYLSDNYAGQSIIVRYSTQPAALLDLMLGRLDLVLGDAAVLQQTFLETEQGEEYAFVGPPLWAPKWFGYGNGVAVSKHNAGLLQLLDRAVADIRVNGGFERIRRTWFPGGLGVTTGTEAGTGTGAADAADASGD